jgi:hypothetical protein
VIATTILLRGSPAWGLQVGIVGRVLGAYPKFLKQSEKSMEQYPALVLAVMEEMGKGRRGLFHLSMPASTLVTLS